MARPDAAFNKLMAKLSGLGADIDAADAMLRSLKAQGTDLSKLTPSQVLQMMEDARSPTAPRRGPRSPVTVEQRVGGDPSIGLAPDGRIREFLRENDPEFFATIDRASPDEIMAAYDNAIARMDGTRPLRRPSKAPQSPPPPPAAKPPENFFVGDAPTRQLELPLGPGAREPDIRALIPYGVRGPGVPVGGIGGPGSLIPRSTDMIPAPLRGRTGSSPQSVIDVPFEVLPPRTPSPPPRPASPPPPAPPLATAGDMADGPYPGMPSRLPDAPVVKDRGPRIPWGALGAGAAGGYVLSRNVLDNAGPASADPKPPKNSSTADLVEETRPAPKVEATPDVPKPTVKQGQPDYAAQARQLIARANDIQRQAGRQTPESIALINEANRLYELAAEGRRSGSQPALMPVEQQNQQTSSIQRDARQQIEQNQGDDYRSQARRLMAVLNIRSSQGNISASEYAAVKRRIDELFALADQQDNSRRPVRPGAGRTQLIGQPKGGPQLLAPPPRLRRRSSPSTT